MGAPGPINTGGRDLVLFDGVCNLCNGAVQFILRRDPKGKFCFASLQSEVARGWMKENNLDPSTVDTIVLVEGGRFFLRSDAVLKIAKKLGGIWSWFSVFFILPKFLRDGLYDLIARSRYRIFGRRESCMVPSDNWRSRFIS